VKSLIVTKKNFEVSGKPSSSEVTQHLSGDLDLVCKGKVLVSVRRYANAAKLSALHDAARKIKYPTNAKRTNGLPVKNRSFGFTTRNVIRGDYCSASSLAREASEVHRELCDFSSEIARVYSQCLPAAFEDHARRAINRISAEWTLGTDQDVFTSGNANRNNAIAYHFDTGNIKGACSAMIVLRSNVTGGELILPEYDVGIYLADGDCLFFDGQGILHGVTPLVVAEGGYRISLVYYTLDQMWKCLTGTKEIERIKKEKTEREQAISGKVGYRGGKPEFRKRRDLPNK
jgi:hypothetical protein